MNEEESKPKFLTSRDILKEQKPITYKSNRYGIIRVCPYLSVNDLVELGKYSGSDPLHPKEFTLHVLSLVVKRSREDISTWNDKTLIAVARKWVKAAMPNDDGSGEINTFDDFQSVVLAHLKKSWAEIEKSMAGMRAGIAKQVESIAKPVMAILNRQLSMIASMQPTIASISDAFIRAAKLSEFASSLIPKLPDFTNFLISVKRSVEDAEEIREILSLAEYELAPLLLDARELKNLKGKSIKQIATRKLMAVTLSDDFSNEIERLFENPVLRKRRMAIKQAMYAHKSRQYYLSTPVFIAQAEGVFTELLVVRNLAERVKGEVVGKRDGNRLNSLQKKVNLAKGRFDPGLEKTSVDIVLNRMVSKRNAILHGGNNTYGTSRMSTETLLLLYALASFLESDLDDLSKESRENKRKNPRSSVKSV